MNLNGIPIHIIDFEGGLQSGVVEYGIATVYNGLISTTHTRLCRPYGHISSQETMCHGIFDNDVSGVEPLNKEWELFSSLRKTGPFAAHNAVMEHQMLKSIWPYTSSTINFLNGESTITWGPWIDTLRLYENLYKQLPSYKLESLIEIFQLQEDLESLANIHCPKSRRQFHCALYDAIACALLIIHVAKCSNFASFDLPWLLKYSSTQHDVRQMELFS